MSSHLCWDDLRFLLSSSCSRTAARRRRRPLDRRRSLRPSGSSCSEGRRRRAAAAKVPALHLNQFLMTFGIKIEKWDSWAEKNPRYRCKTQFHVWWFSQSNQELLCLSDLLKHLHHAPHVSVHTDFKQDVFCLNLLLQNFSVSLITDLEVVSVFASSARLHRFFLSESRRTSLSFLFYCFFAQWSKHAAPGASFKPISWSLTSAACTVCSSTHKHRHAAPITSCLRPEVINSSDGTNVRCYLVTWWRCWIIKD